MAEEVLAELHTSASTKQRLVAVLVRTVVAASRFKATTAEDGGNASTNDSTSAPDRWMMPRTSSTGGIHGISGINARRNTGDAQQAQQFRSRHLMSTVRVLDTLSSIVEDMLKTRMRGSTLLPPVIGELFQNVHNAEGVEGVGEEEKGNGGQM